MASKPKDNTEAIAPVLEYLKKQNRPYSAIDIFNNLHKAYSKPIVIKVLELLASEDKIKEKTYGKQKVYVICQNIFADVNETELQDLTIRINQMSDQLQAKQEKFRKLDNEFKIQKSSITTEDARTELDELETTNKELSSRLNVLQSNTDNIDPEEKEKIIGKRTKYIKEWKKRKRMTDDILNAVLEGYPKKRKDLIEDIGLETDDDLKISLPKI